MLTRRFLVAAGALLCAGCATRPPPPPPGPVLAPAGLPFAELEPLYAADAGRDSLTIQVSSKGCTRKADFAFFVERKGGAVQLAFGRKRLDVCKAFAVGRTPLSFSYAELGLDRGTPIFLLNPLQRWTGP